MARLPQNAWSLGASLCVENPRTVAAVSITMYTQFLLSPNYKHWKANETAAAAAASKDKATGGKPPTANLPFHTPIETKIFDKAISSVDVTEVDRMLETGSWLSSMLLAVENLPVCVSLSTARKDRPGFPLIYVNKAFEKVTGYKREEIVGQNCRFLQAGKAEQESIDRLTVALRDSKPVRVAITNFRKDGMPFKNLLSMKPIFDEEGEYRYVVGVQFDVTQEDATPQKLKLADEVIKMLPNVIVAHDGEQL